MLFFLLGCSFLSVVLGDSQDSQSGFISIDCGTQKDTNYTDETTGLRYISDDGLIDTGISHSVSVAFMDNTLRRQFLNVRSFSQGNRSCYLLRPPEGKSKRYLLRAQFMYGNYDSLNTSPIFDLHLGLDYWDTVTFPDQASSYVTKEIIHTPSTNIMNFCLVNIGRGTPFISVLELRPLNNAIYTTESGSLHIITRANLGSTSTQLIRYEDDMYDRIWDSNTQQSERALNTTLAVKVSPTNFFKPPLNVMSTAVAPTDHLQYTWGGENFSDEFYIYVHYSELEQLQINQSREFNIYLNGVLCNTKGPIVPEYLIANSFYSVVSQGNDSAYKRAPFINNGPIIPEYLIANSFYSIASQGNKFAYELIINKTLHSTLPPIVSALEIYSLKKLLSSQTDENDVAAVTGIKLMYKMTRNWQGDPCAPEDYIWVGLNCSYDDSNPPRIISMNLSSSGLTGMMSSYISNLTMIQSLDLSNNNLTGILPDFLAELESLKILNLKGNNFTGPIPVKLQEKSLLGQLSLSVDDVASSKEMCTNSQCKKRTRVPILVGVPIAIVVGIVILLAVICIAIRKRRTNTATSEVEVVEVDADSQEIDGELEINVTRYTHSEILNITNNKNKIIGRGSFGIVYYGKIGNTEVAVKMLLQSRDQGLRELQEEARVPLRVHHRNITPLIGYCIDGTNMGIIYEYMANGDLGKYLFDPRRVLSYQKRLKIAIDAAQGLEYLHHGCHPAIVHRDIKSSNILLNGKLEAKVADFGLCKAFPIEGGTHISTINVAGTIGYLDPEYNSTHRLTVKSDVYSFGVVLLELLTSRLAIVQTVHSKIHITDWVASFLSKRDVNVNNIVDQRLMEDFDVESMRKVLNIAMKCASLRSAFRPTMNPVVMELKECLAMEMTRLENTGQPSSETYHSFENM